MTNAHDEPPPDEVGDLDPERLLEAGLAGPDEPGLEPERLARAFPALTILSKLGRGGMGVVYRAKQTNLDREVALKILLPHLADEAGFADRFAREAKALARLDHPNIVRVYEAGETDGLCFLLMEYVDGVNLRQAMHDRPLEPAEALRIVPQVCDALQYAHDAGIVHRDVKPENILLARGGAVKIADFGLAKIVGGPVGDASLTGVEQVMGTFRYIAPEQIETPKEVDHRADVFSLGVVFYEMLTGDLPIGRFAPPSEKVEVDVRLDEVVLRTLERERERRYQQVSEVKSGLESATSAPAGVRAAPPTPHGPAPRTSGLAIAGILGIPAAVITWVLVVASGARDEHATLAAAAVAAVGMTLSFIARAAIRADPERLAGGKLARAGILLPPALGLLAVLVMLGIYYIVLPMSGQAPWQQRERAEAERRAAAEAAVDEQRMQRLEADLEHTLTQLVALGPAVTPADLMTLVAPSARKDVTGLVEMIEGDPRTALAELLWIDLDKLAAGAGTYRVGPVEIEGRYGIATISGSSGTFRIRMIEEDGAWYFDPGEHRLEDR